MFIDEGQVAKLEKKMNERGYLEGCEMASTFNLLRANDLIWSFVVNNYLLGKDPFPFDLLYWNSDSTRMPARMHSFYLRNMYINNLLGEPGGITLDGVPIDLSKVDVPSVFRLDDRGPHRAVEDHLHGRALPRRPGALRARRLGPHRRHRQSAGGEQVPLLDQRLAARDGRRVVRRAPRSSRARGGTTGSAGSTSRTAASKVPARIPANAARGCARQLRDGIVRL